MKHVYDPTSGELNSSVVALGNNVPLDKMKRASQPYRHVGPGVLPVVMAVSQDIVGKKLLVTRKVAPRGDDQGVSGHLYSFGVRIMMYSDEVAGETIVEWTCLYGVQ